MPWKNLKDKYYAVWTTAWGSMGGVAGCERLHRLVLPHYRADDLRELLAWEHPEAVFDEEQFGRLIELTRKYFNAREVDFGVIPCGLPPETSFSGRVYRTARNIPYGETLSYSGLARKIGREDAARSVATAMSKNRIPLVVPCHRVIYADGRPGGFSAEGGIPLKVRMLELEKQAMKDI